MLRDKFPLVYGIVPSRSREESKHVTAPEVLGVDVEAVRIWMSSRGKPKQRRLFFFRQSKRQK